VPVGLLVSVAALPAAACSNAVSGGGPSSSATGGQGGHGGAGTTASSTATGFPVSSSATGGTTGSGGPGGAASFLGYAATGTTLYTVGPGQSLAITQVGEFDCIGGAGQDPAMTDIAVDEAGDLWGVSAHDAYPLVIQGSTVHCAKTLPLASVQATSFRLAFAPAGVIDAASATVVVGDTSGALWKLDTTTGILEQHGTLGAVPADDGHGHTYANAGKPWEVSGDLVFFVDNGVPRGFATVSDCPSPPSPTGCDGTDTLLELDMTQLKAAGTQDVTLAVRGQTVKASGCSDSAHTSYGGIAGLALWNTHLYGFSRHGYIVALSQVDGSACLLVDTSQVWAGAASAP
jgi:hypothetical protein